MGSPEKSADFMGKNGAPAVSGFRLFSAAPVYLNSETEVFNSYD